MKKLILGTAICAVIGNSAWAQVQADTSGLCGPAEGDGDMIFAVCTGYDMSNDDSVIVTADRLGYSDKTDLTVPSSVLTEAQIAARGQQYVSQLLRALPGIAVSQSGSGAGLTQIRVRGSEANQVLVLIDGVEVANPSTGEFDLSGLRAADVVKIEVLRGEQSALYGSDAIGGVISIITRAGETRERWRATLEAGSRDTGEIQASAVIPLGGAALSLNGNAFRTDGYDVSGLDGERDGATSRNINIGLNALEIGGLRLDAKYGSGRRVGAFDEDNTFDGRLNDTDSETTVNTDTARLDGRFTTGEVDHKLSAAFSSTDTDTRAGFSTRTRGERLTASWVGGYETGAHSLTTLGEFERETYEITPNFTEADARPENETFGLAADYRYDANNVTLSGSVRHDINDLFADATTWRVGAGYDFAWNGRLRGSVGTGVKNPSLIELFGFFPGSRFSGNRDLKPERSLGLSVGYEQRIGGFRGSVDVFSTDLENEIATIFNPDFTSTVINLETDSQRQGVELEAGYRVGTLSLSGSATFLDSEENDVTEIRRPDFTASASAAWTATENLSLSAQIDHTGSQLDTDFGTFQTVELDSFTLVSGRAAYAFSDTASVYVRGTNLLDEDYQQLVGYASQGRSVYAGLALDF